MDKEFRIEIKVKNNIFLSKLEKAGYKTLGEFCRLNNLPPSHIGNYVNLKKSPLNIEGDFYKILYTVATLLNCSPENLFSESQLHLELKSNKRSIAVNEAEMQFMIENNYGEQKLLEENIFEDQKNKEVEELLKTIPSRYQKVLEMRMGLGEYVREHTLDEVGKELGIQRERVRQLEAKALRMLRHPSRADKVREFNE